MKRFLLLAVAGLAFATSCNNDDNNNTPTPTAPSNRNDSLVVLSGDLPTMTLTDSVQRTQGGRTYNVKADYQIQGFTFVRSGNVLTIPAGTVITGDKGSKGTLIIDRGGQIIANGTAERPIIFTSERDRGERERGDWGGIVILGRAQVNQTNPPIEGVTPEVIYGSRTAENNGESSGSMTYCRIEYAGIALSPNNETNSLTMGGVGSGTRIEHVQVSYGGDDGFEWFGGTVNGKYLVSYATWDDDFDVDFGYTGNNQYGIALRDPFGADQSGSNGFECDNDASGTGATPLTAGVFSNITIVGPRRDSATSISGNYQHAAHIRRNTAVSIFNSAFMGFSTGINIDGANTLNNYTSGTAAIEHNVIALAGRLAASANNAARLRPVIGTSGITDAQAQAYVFDPARMNVNASGSTVDYTAAGFSRDLFFNQVLTNPANANFVVSGGVLSSGAMFNHPKLQGGFFDQVAYRGAFGGTDWTRGWTSFQPNTENY